MSEKDEDEVHHIKKEQREKKKEKGKKVETFFFFSFLRFTLDRWEGGCLPDSSEEHI